MTPPGTPSLTIDKIVDESNETISSDQNLEAPTTHQDPEKTSLGLSPNAEVEQLARKEGKDEEIVYPGGLKLFILASVCHKIVLQQRQNH